MFGLNDLGPLSGFVPSELLGRRPAFLDLRVE